MSHTRPALSIDETSVLTSIKKATHPKVILSIYGPFLLTNGPEAMESYDLKAVHLGVMLRRINMGWLILTI